MDVNFELYKVFYHVANSLSFSEAAKALFISQSAVSQSIKQLESLLGESLFLRSTKKVALTPQGQTLKVYVDEAVSLLRFGEQTILEQQRLSSGEIFVACTDTLCKYFLLLNINRFNKAYQNIRFSIANATSTKCLELLQGGKINFALVNLPEGLDPKQFTVEKTLLTTDVFVCASALYDRVKKPASLAVLANLPLIVLEKNTVTRDYFDRLFAQAGLPVSPEIEVGSVDILMEMVQTGLGVGFVPDYAAAKNPALRVLPLTRPLKERKAGIITLKKLKNTPLCDKFISLFQFEKSHEVGVQ